MFSDDKIELNCGEEFSFVKFRAHQRGFSGLEAYIIGEENRKQKIQRDIENLKLDFERFEKS